jgi:hypothetical protein
MLKSFQLLHGMYHDPSVNTSKTNISVGHSLHSLILSMLSPLACIIAVQSVSSIGILNAVASVAKSAEATRMHPLFSICYSIGTSTISSLLHTSLLYNQCN